MMNSAYLALFLSLLLSLFRPKLARQLQIPNGTVGCWLLALNGEWWIVTVEWRLVQESEENRKAN